MSSILTQAGGAAGFVSADLQTGPYHELIVGLNVTALSGGVTPSVGFVLKMRGEDGTLYQIAAPTALTVVSSIVYGFGAGIGASPSVNFGDLVQVSIVVAGGPTGCAWTLSMSGK
jgi:hypothetical protein